MEIPYSKIYGGKCFEIMEDIVLKQDSRIKNKIRKTLLKAHTDFLAIEKIEDKEVKVRVLNSHRKELLRALGVDHAFSPKVHEFIETCIIAMYRSRLRKANGTLSKHDS